MDTRQCSSLLVLPAALAHACGVGWSLLMVLTARVRNALWPPASFIFSPGDFVLLLCNVHGQSFGPAHTSCSPPVTLGAKCTGSSKPQHQPWVFSSHFLYPGSKEMVFLWKGINWVILLSRDHNFRIIEIVFISVLGTWRF